jgi:hypothetical protein
MRELTGCAIRPAASGETLQEEQKLESLRQNIRAAIEAKTAIATEVIHGQLTLTEAARAFRRAEADLPSELIWQSLEAFPGNCSGERICRKVIGYASRLLAADPTRQLQLTQRLEAELQQHLDIHGTVSVPLDDEEGECLRELPTLAPH